MLLETLCNENGVSGSEGAVRNIILDYIRPYADEITVDTMGNIIALKKGASDAKRVMIAAHMDEVGFIISGITDDGYLKFKTVGGIDTRVIISKRVRIDAEKIPGVIGMKAIHVQKKSEREEIPEVKSLYIDIGAKDAADAKKHVKFGDYAAFDTKFADFGAGKIKAKAIDDRAGCAIMTELIKSPVKYDTYFCFTVQEEVGLRGAGIAAYRVKPDIALVLESTTCSDVYKTEPHEHVTTLGGGAAVTAADRRTIVPAKLSAWLYDEGKKAGIPVQYKRAAAGGNDAGIIHLTRGGCPTAAVSIPARYIHSPVSIADTGDIDAVMKLARMFLDRIDELI